MEVLNREHGDYIEDLIRKSENGLNTDWQKVNNFILDLQSLEHIGNFLFNILKFFNGNKNKYSIPFFFYFSRQNDGKRFNNTYKSP